MKSLSRPSWVLLLCVVAHGAACVDSRSDKQKYTDALANIEAADFRAAIVDLKTLLLHNPDNADVRLALGKAALALGDVWAAEKELLHARDLGANPDDYAEALARSMLARGAFADLLAQVDDSVVANPATAAIVRALRGNAQMALGAEDDAHKIFDEIIAAKPDLEAVRIALLGKAELAKRNANLTGAEALVRRSLEFVPDSAESTLALGQLLMLQDKQAQAEEVFGWGREQFTTSAINNFLFSAGLVEALLGQNKFEEAATAVEALELAAPEHPTTGYLKGRAAFQSGDIDAAAGHLQGVLAKFPNYEPAQTLFGAVSLKRGDLKQAKMWLSNAVAANPGNAAARDLLVETRLKMSRPDDAFAALKDGLRNDADNPELLAMLGQAAAQGDQEEGIRYLRESVKRNPTPQTILTLASVYIADGQSEEATTLIESLPADAMNKRRRRLLLVMSRFDRNNPAGSLAQVDGLVAKYPEDAAIVGFAGSSYLHNQQNAKARQSFDRVLELEPQNRGAIVNLGRLDQLEGNFDSSKRHFEAYLAAHPRDLLSLMALARIAGQQGETERAMELVDQANDAHPEALMPNLSLAGRALQTGDLAAAERHARAAVNGNPAAASAHAALGLYQLRARESQDAYASLRKAVDLRRDSHLYKSYLARAQIVIGRLADARESYVEVLRLKSDYLPAARALALLDIGADRAPEAEGLLARLKSDYGERPQVLEIEGDVRAAQGQFAEAAAAYAAAEKINPSRALAIKGYTIRSKNGLPNAADSLTRWLERSPDDVSARVLLAQELQRSGERAQAAEQYEMIVKLQPENVLVLNNLAWLYFETADTDARPRALELSMRAHELVPANRDVADTYGWILIRSGRLDDGREILETALRTSDPASDPELAYHLAAALQQIGGRDRAKTLLRAALASERPFHERDDAQALHDSL